MCFITVNDLNERLQRPQYKKLLGDLLCLEIPPPTNDDDDTWPCICAVLHSGTRAMLWTIFGRGKVYNEVAQVIAEFNRELG